MPAASQHAGKFSHSHPLFVSRSWGYTYSIFFDGNAFYNVGGVAPSPPSLSAIDDTSINGCSEFSTTIDGVLTPLDLGAAEYGVAATSIANGGFSLSESATADQVTDGLSVLPSVSAPMLTYRGVADEQQGNSWTLSFSSNGGAVAQLVCVAENTNFVHYCDVSTYAPKRRETADASFPPG